MIDKVNACSCNVSSAFPAYTASSPLTETVVFSPSLSLSRLSLSAASSLSFSLPRAAGSDFRSNALSPRGPTYESYVPRKAVHDEALRLCCTSEPCRGGRCPHEGRGAWRGVCSRPAQLYLPHLAWPRRSYLASPAAVCVRLASCVPSAPRETRWDPQTPTAEPNRFRRRGGRLCVGRISISRAGRPGV